MPVKTKKLLSERALGFWGAAAILWSLYKYYFYGDFLFSEIVLKPLIFVGTAFLFTKYVEKKSLLQITQIFPLTKRSFLISSIIILISVVLIWFISNTPLPKTIAYILANLGTASAEDILMFALVLRSYHIDKKNYLNSIVTVALLYTLLRIPGLFTIPKIQGLLLVNILLSGFFLMLALGIIYSRTRKLYPVILIHFIYLNIITLFAL